MRVSGFEFESSEMAEKATRELQAVQYVKEHTKMDNPDVVFKVYTALVDGQPFETPVGYTFLEELQEYLRTIPYIKSEDIKPIVVQGPAIPTKIEKVKKEKKKRPEKVKRERVKSSEPPRYRVLFHVCLFFSIVFLFIIGGMFTITYLSGDNVNILNYEEKLIDRYEKWEQELDERERQLIEREKELQK